MRRTFVTPPSHGASSSRPCLHARCLYLRATVSERQLASWIFASSFVLWRSHHVRAVTLRNSRVCVMCVLRPRTGWCGEGEPGGERESALYV